MGVGVAVDASSAYFLDDENKLTGVDLAAGNKSWSSEIGGTVVSNLLILDDSIMLVTSLRPESSTMPIKSSIQALSRKTGVTEWSAEITSSPGVWLGSVSGIIVAVGSDGAVSGLSPVDGKLIWNVDVTSKVSAAPSFHESEIEIATGKNEVVKVSGDNGRIQVDWRAEYLPTAVLLDMKRRLFVGDERGNLTLVSPDGDQLWAFRNGAQISSATLYGSYYLAASYDNFVYKLSRSGDVKWKRRLSGRVHDGPLILGDTAVVSIAGSGSVYVLDLKNGKISNRIETGDEEASLRLTPSPNSAGFAVAGPRGISYFSTAKCPAK
jgi:outer membrane protein assembly factor BamB